MAHTRQSRPNSGLGSQITPCEPSKMFPFRSAWAGWDRCFPFQSSVIGVDCFLMYLFLRFVCCLLFSVFSGSYSACGAEEAPFRGGVHGTQGYLAHKKPPHSSTLLEGGVGPAGISSVKTACSTDPCRTPVLRVRDSTTNPQQVGKEVSPKP